MKSSRLFLNGCVYRCIAGGIAHSREEVEIYSINCPAHGRKNLSVTPVDSYSLTNPDEQPISLSTAYFQRQQLPLLYSL